MIEEIIPKKRCSMCTEYLPITDFTTHKRGKYGRASQCRACIRKYCKSPHIQERRNRYNKNYKYKHNRESSDRYRATHRTQIEEYLARPETRVLTRIRKARYHALRAGAPGTFTQEQFLQKCEYYGWCCYLCRRPLTLKTIVVEHRIPLSRGGTNWIANLAPSCKSCNHKKYNLTDREYKARSQSEYRGVA